MRVVRKGCVERGGVFGGRWRGSRRSWAGQRRRREQMRESSDGAR
jgi:hypothetical protein